MTHPLTCAQCRGYLPLFTAAQLDATARQAVAHHLATCAACRQELANWQAIAEAVRDSRSDIQPASPDWDDLQRRLDIKTNHDMEAFPPMNLPPLRGTRQPLSQRHADAQPRGITRQNRAWPIVAIVLLVVIVSALAFDLTRRASPGFVPDGPCAHTTIRAQIPARGTIANIAMTSATDGWGVGWTTDPAGTQGNYIESLWDPSTPLIMHYHDCQWTPVTVKLPHAQLFSVSMGSADDGWAVGATIHHVPDPGFQGSDTLAYDQTILLHYTQGTWQQVPAPISTPLQRAQVQMISPDEGWMIGDVKAGKNPQPLDHDVILLHYLHGVWTQIATAALGHLTSIIKLVAVAPGECWFATSGAVMHYQQQTWTKQEFPDAFINDMAMIAPDDGWVAGFQIGGAGSFLARYDGVHWNPVPAPALPDKKPSKGYDFGLNSISMTTSNDVWAIGVSEFGLYLAHDQFGAWTTQSLIIDHTYHKGHASGISAITMVSPTEGWILAYQTLQEFGPVQTFFVHYDGQQWIAIGN